MCISVSNLVLISFFFKKKKEFCLLVKLVPVPELLSPTDFTLEINTALNGFQTSHQILLIQVGKMKHIKSCSSCPLGNYIP